jgi:repressor LexA
MMNFGERLKKIRIERGLRQEDIGKIVHAGKSTVSQWENNIHVPDLETVTKIVAALNIPLDYLLGRTDSRFGDRAAEEAQVPYSHHANLRLIPVLGIIRAGDPLFAYENIIGYEPVNADEIKNGDYFFLKVTGDSMSGPGSRIQEGDLVLVKKQDYIENGQIAVVLVNSDEATLKRVYVQGEQYILQADNPKYPPMAVSAKELKIIGRVLKGNYTL